MVYERLVRRILALPGKPAVVLMQVRCHGLRLNVPLRLGHRHQHQHQHQRACCLVACTLMHPTLQGQALAAP